MLERGSFTVSVQVVRNAIGLLDEVLDALADPARWCKGAFAVDGAGKSIGGLDIVAAVEHPDVVARCAFGEALHLAMTSRRWRVEITVTGEPPTLLLTRAPDSFVLAALALAQGALEIWHKSDDWPEPSEPEPRDEQPEFGRILLASVVANDLPETTHEDAIRMIVFGIEYLRGLLGRVQEQPS